MQCTCVGRCAQVGWHLTLCAQCRGGSRWLSVEPWRRVPAYLFGAVHRGAPDRWVGATSLWRLIVELLHYERPGWGKLPPPPSARFSCTGPLVKSKAVSKHTKNKFKKRGEGKKLWQSRYRLSSDL